MSALVAGVSQQTILLQYRDLLNEDAPATAREASYTKHEVASRARARLASDRAGAQAILDGLGRVAGESREKAAVFVHTVKDKNTMSIQGR